MFVASLMLKMKKKFFSKQPAEELALEEMFTSDEVEFLSPEELQKEKKNLKAYQVQKAEKKSVNIRLLASDIAKIKAKSEAI